MANISYNKTNWVNGTTALNADNLNNIEMGVDNVTKAVNNKVDKVAGKGLSTHDFNDHYKNAIDNLQGGISVIELTNKNGTIASAQLSEINANPQNFAFKYNGKILLFTSASSATYQYCNNTTSSSDNNVMTTSTLLTITSSTGAYTIAENVHNVVANSIHPANGGDLTNIQVGSKVYSIPSGGESIPVVEGTVGEATGQGDIATIDIPTAQTNNFILHIADQNANIYMQHFGDVFCSSIPVSNVATYIFIIFGTQGLVYTSSYIEHIKIMSNVDPITFSSAGYFSRGSSDDILYSKINENLVTPLYPSLEDTNKYTYYCTDENKMLQEKQVQLEETQTATLFNKYKIKIPKGVEYNDVILPFTTLDNEDDGKVLTIVNKQVQWATPAGGGSISVTFED